MLRDEDGWPISCTLWRRSQRSLAGGVSTGLRATAKPHPLFFARAAGARIWDVDGHEFVDYVLGWGPTLLGHCHPAVTQAVCAQADQGETFGAQHHLEYEVAEAILDHFAWAERLVYSNTGTEAVQVALRLSRAFTGRRKILKFVGHYHGWADSVLVSYRPPSEVTTPYLESRGQDPAAADALLVAPWNDEAAIDRIFAHHGHEIAAIIAEPVMINSGTIWPQPGFLAFLRRCADEWGSLLIFDEVITGLRIGPGGAASVFGVQPDLAVLGKAVANGYPLSVVVGRGDVMDLIARGGVVHAGTFNGNPIVLAASQATLKIIDQQSVLATVADRAETLAQGLREVFGGVPVHIGLAGGVVQIVPGREQPLRDYAEFARAPWAWYEQLMVALLRRGLFVLPGGRLYLSAAHGTTEIDQTLAAFAAALSDIDFLPEGA